MGQQLWHGDRGYTVLSLYQLRAAGCVHVGTQLLERGVVVRRAGLALEFSLLAGRAPGAAELIEQTIDLGRTTAGRVQQWILNSGYWSPRNLGSRRSMDA